ncbi:MAG TPA: long-chain fatty acid--CoA ligase [Bacillota bacterium]
MEARVWHKSYEPEVRPSIDYPQVPVYQFVYDSASKRPDGTAIIFFNRKFTYRWLKDQVDKFATAMTAMGVKKGDRVAIMLPNCPQVVIAYYGALRAGATVVLTNPMYVDRELEFQMNDSGAETIVILDHLWPRLDKVRAKTPLKRLIIAGMAEYMPFPLSALYPIKARRDKLVVGVQPGSGAIAFKDLVAKYAAAPSAVTHDLGGDAAVLQYTGGTTGTAKGAVLTHKNLVANVMQCREWFHKSRWGEEVMVGALPLFHSYGMTSVMNMATFLGSSMILLPRFVVKDVLENIQRHKATIFCGAPTMYVACNNYPEIKKYNLKSIESCISGSAALMAETQNKFQEITQGKLVEGYGLSESTPVTHANPIWGKGRIGSIGLPVPDTDAKIVDLETGQRDLPPGEVGELVIKGPQVMKGYWNRSDETAKTLRDGWLYTGDIAKMDEEGYFYVVDRKKDMIIAGGFNIYPRDVEEILFEHPKVLEAAVAGVPDPYRGETVKAYVILKPGETATPEEIIQFCRDHMAAFKAPRQVEFRTSLPKTIVGKVLRRVLVEEEKVKLAKEGEGIA